EIRRPKGDRPSDSPSARCPEMRSIACAAPRGHLKQRCSCNQLSMKFIVDEGANDIVHRGVGGETEALRFGWTKRAGPSADDLFDSRVGPKSHALRDIATSNFLQCRKHLLN